MADAKKSMKKATVKKHESPDVSEYTARAYGFGYFGSYSDLGIGEFGRLSYDKLEKIAKDDQVKSTIQQRLQAAMATEWNITGDGKNDDAIEMLTGDLKQCSFEAVYRQMLKNALQYGFSVAEILWEYGAGKWHIGAIKVRHPSHFTFDDITGELRFSGMIMPPNKFWVYRHNPDNWNDFYGKGLLYDCYWPVYFKTYGIKEWAKYLNYAGDPPLIGKYPAERSKDEDINKMLDMLEAAKANGVCAIPVGSEVELLQAQVGSTLDYKEFYHVMDMAISKTVLSQTMTTDQGASLSQSKTHMEVREEVVKGDVDMLSDSFTKQILAPYCFWNGLGDLEFRRKFDDTDRMNDEELKAIEMVNKMQVSGYEPNEIWMNSRLPNWNRAKKAKSGSSASNSPDDEPKADEVDFAEGVADYLAAQLADFVDAPMTEAIGTIKKIMDESEDLPTLARRLTEEYSNIDFSDVAEVMGSAMTASYLKGYSDRADGNGSKT